MAAEIGKTLLNKKSLDIFYDAFSWKTYLHKRYIIIIKILSVYIGNHKDISKTDQQKRI